MRVTALIILILHSIKLCYCKNMEPFVVDGHDADIKKFPYCASLSISCVSDDANKIYYVCGASIINQHLTLTAAHCNEGCTTETDIVVSAGQAMKSKGAVSSAHSFISHKEFNPPAIVFDISLVRLKTPLKFSAKVSRVALMANPPYEEDAMIAGWGLWDEEHKKFPKGLQYTKQHVKDKDVCSRLLQSLNHPKDGTFCASNIHGYAAKGDSGSALVVRNYIQIGLVSYKLKHTTKTNKKVAVYTDTGFYYEWIQNTSSRIMCL